MALGITVHAAQHSKYANICSSDLPWSFLKSIIFRKTSFFLTLYFPKLKTCDINPPKKLQRIESPIILKIETEFFHFWLPLLLTKILCYGLLKLLILRKLDDKTSSLVSQYLYILRGNSFPVFTQLLSPPYAESLCIYSRNKNIGYIRAQSTTFLLESCEEFEQEIVTSS